MMKDDIQKQATGDNSTNLQGKEITIYQGISYKDAKEIALDVYKANFLALSEKAATEAVRRAEELTDTFLEKLKEEMPAAVQALQEPAMQMALYTAQKEYARTGDKDLESLLVDILVERAQQTERTIQQIVLDESLAVAPKLTLEQLSALTVSFLLTRTRIHFLVSLDALQNYLESHLLPFVDDLTKAETCYEHLEYTGCGSVMRLGNLRTVEAIFNLHYPGLFCKGFESERVSTEFGDVKPPAGFLINCLHAPRSFRLTQLIRSSLVSGVRKTTCQNRWKQRCFLSSTALACPMKT